jgi:hypothetical protein
MVHVVEQGGVDALAGADRAVVDGLLGTEVAEFVQARMHHREVSVAPRHRAELTITILALKRRGAGNCRAATNNNRTIAELKQIASSSAIIQ